MGLIVDRECIRQAVQEESAAIGPRSSSDSNSNKVNKDNKDNKDNSNNKAVATSKQLRRKMVAPKPTAKNQRKQNTLLCQLQQQLRQQQQ